MTFVAFQAGAFQQDSYQVATDILSATAAYSLGSPAFLTPTLQTFPFLALLYGNPYSLASPVFSGSTPGQVHNIFASVFEPQPDFANPNVQVHSSFAIPTYTLGSPVFATPTALITDPVVAASYSLGSPRFGYPRMTYTAIAPRWPLTYINQVAEAGAVLAQLLDYLQSSIPPGTSDEQNDARRKIYDLRVNTEAAIRGNNLGTQLAEAVLATDLAGATYLGVENARQYLMSQVASRSLMTQIVFRSALLMVLGLEANIIARRTYKTRDDVQQMILHCRDMFEAAKAIGIDEVDALVYQALNTLGGALIHNLSVSQLQMPRFVSYSLAAPMPSLYIANRVYADASRADEIANENRVIHPAFCPLNIRVLSNNTWDDRYFSR